MRNYYESSMVQHLEVMELIFDNFKHHVMQFVEEKKMLLDNFKPDMMQLLDEEAAPKLP